MHHFELSISRVFPKVAQRKFVDYMLDIRKINTHCQLVSVRLNTMYSSRGRIARIENRRENVSAHTFTYIMCLKVRSPAAFPKEKISTEARDFQARDGAYFIFTRYRARRLVFDAIYS